MSLETPADTSLLVKESAYETACDFFKCLLMELKCWDDIESATKVIIGEWCNDIVLLAEIAQSQPQAAYSSFIHGLFGKWCYFSN